VSPPTEWLPLTLPLSTPHLEYPTTPDVESRSPHQANSPSTSSRASESSLPPFRRSLLNSQLATRFREEKARNPASTSCTPEAVRRISTAIPGQTLTCQPTTLQAGTGRRWIRQQPRMDANCRKFTQTRVKKENCCYCLGFTVCHQRHIFIP
jgi:hypothetical protein